jgi:hypothetical protein
MSRLETLGVTDSVTCVDTASAGLDGDVALRPASPLPSDVLTSNGHPEERRRSRRVERHEFSSDVRLTMPGLSKIVMVNISETGALVETSRPLNPGMAANLFVRLNGKRHALRVTTVRSALYAITPKSGVVYRTALKFDKRVPLETGIY